MPNIANVFKAEISRLTRKEIRTESSGQKKTLAAHRAEIAALKRRVATLETAIKTLLKEQGSKRGKPASVPAAPGDMPDDAGHRFNAKGLATNRKRLGLSAADFALLVGTTGQSIYAWESGKATPRAKALKAIAALRGVGKRVVAERLASLKG